VNENVNDKHVNQCSNDRDDTHHNETNEQTEDELNEPSVDTDTVGNQDSVDNVDVESESTASTPPFVVTDQSKLTELIVERQNDHTLTNCMHQANVGKGNYFFKFGALFHREKFADQWVKQLMLPQT